MGRSNINLVGNTTQGQNLGGGECVFKAKSFGNIMQYKTLSVTGTTMSITSDGDNIYFSADTGGGGSTPTGTACSVAVYGGDTCLTDSDLLYDDSSGIMCFSGTGAHAICGRCGDATAAAGSQLQVCAGGNYASGALSAGDLILSAGDNNASSSGGQITISPGIQVNGGTVGQINLGKPSYTSTNIGMYVQGTNTNIGLSINPKGTGALTLGCSSLANINMNVSNVQMVNAMVINKDSCMLWYGACDVYICGSRGAVDTNGCDLHVKGGCGYLASNCDGGNLVLCGGAPDGSGTSGRVVMPDLPTCVAETNVLYIDASGNLSSGATGSGGGISWDGNTANAIATYIDGSTVCAESGLTYNGGVVCNVGDFTIETDDASCIFLHAPTVAGDCNHIGLGKPTMASGIDINRIVSEGQASNIDVQIWSKGTGYIYLAAPITYIGGVSTTGLQYTTATKSLQVGVAGKFSSKGGNSVAPDGSDICVVGAAPYSQTGFGGDGGGICICGGNAGSGTGHVAAVDGGHVTLKGGLAVNGGTAGNIILDSLPAKTTETDVVYIDASGNLSCGAGGGSSTASFSGLTYASTVNYNVGSTSINTYINSITGNFTLAMSGLVNGMSGDMLLGVTSGPITITLPTSPTSKLNGNVTALPTGTYNLSWLYDGTTLYFNIAAYV